MPLGQLLFSFRGRINRAKYWGTWIGLWAVLIVAALTARFAIFGSMRPSALSESGHVFALVVSLAAGMLGVYVNLALSVKRLHDRERSGWWVLVLVVAPAVLGRISRQVDDTGALIFFLTISTGLGIWGLIEIGILRGTRGPNQFGPDPLARPDDPDAVPGALLSPAQTSRWAYLKQTDPDIAGAAARAAALDPAFEPALAEKYLEMGERKDRLEQLVQALENWVARPRN